MHNKLDQIAEELNRLVKRADQFYVNRFLPYHGIGEYNNHIKDVAGAYRSLFGDPPYETQLVIAWHDSVYVPNSPPGWNEEMSYYQLMHVVKHTIGEARFHRMVDVQVIMEGILATKVANHVSPNYKPPTEEIARILDCDLQSFGRPWIQFLHYQVQVRDEIMGPCFINLYSSTEPIMVVAHNEAAIEEASKKQCDFFKLFLNREFIFHTPEAREAWEDKAKENILAFIDSKS